LVLLDEISNQTNWRLADLFGDGRQVYYTRSYDGSHYATRLNSDETLQNWSWNGGHSSSDAGWEVADLFGDGRQVLLDPQQQRRALCGRVSIPDGTLQNWTWSGGHGVGDASWAIGDLFGDGRQIYYTHSTSGAHQATRLNPDGQCRIGPGAGGHEWLPGKLAMLGFCFDGSQQPDQLAARRFVWRRTASLLHPLIRRLSLRQRA